MNYHKAMNRFAYSSPTDQFVRSLSRKPVPEDIQDVLQELTETNKRLGQFIDRVVALAEYHNLQFVTKEATAERIECVPAGSV